MSVPIVILRADGKLEPADYVAGSLNQAAALEPEGIYTVARTFRTDHAVLLDAHFDRLEESAQLVSIPVHLDRNRVRTALRDLIQSSGYAESRFRITIPTAAPDEVILVVEPLTELPERYYRDGVTAACYSVHRQNPHAKTNDWVHLRERARQALQKDVYEVIALSPDERLLEGFTSNFYAMLQGVLHMEPDRALRGIARRIVMGVVEDIVPIEMQAVKLGDVPQLQEAFMTSSSRGVLPVVQIDDTLIRGGIPGPVTREIQSRYDRWVDDHLESI